MNLCGNAGGKPPAFPQSKMEGTDGTDERYLLILYELSGERETVRSARTAGRLGVSRPSVTRMLGTLPARQLVSKERYGKVSLKEHGAAAARRDQERLPRRERPSSQMRQKLLIFAKHPFLFRGIRGIVRAI